MLYLGILKETVMKVETEILENNMVKVIIGNELYVYYGGSLLYKRWIDQGYGKVFH